MIFEIILAIIIGSIIGTITGLIPGLHINLVSVFLLASLSNSSFLAGFPALSLAIFVVSMSITHTFLDFIPSIFLGAPEEDTFLSVLPGHQLLKEGRGYEAVVYALYGSILAIPILILIAFPFSVFIPYLFNFIKDIIPYILIGVSLFLIFRDKKVLTALAIFILSGITGYLAFNLPVKEPLTPLLTGLFGLSALIISTKLDRIQKQNIPLLKNIRLPKQNLIKNIFSASIAGPLCSFLPGIGSGHATILASEVTDQESNQFIFLNGIINTIVMGLSFVTAYSIGKTRTGSAAAVKEILNTITPSNIAIIILAITLSGLLAFLIGVNASKLAAKNINKINYKNLNFLIISLLIVFNFFISNWQGMILLFFATILGIFTISSGVRRINLMGCLLIPSIVYYLFN